jgi:hypothetical protein
VTMHQRERLQKALRGGYDWIVINPEDVKYG